MQAHGQAKLTQTRYQKALDTAINREQTPFFHQEIRMMNFRCLIILLSLPFSLAQSSTNESSVPVNTVKKYFVYAQVTDQKSWCSPAVLVGPKTFITAAHCAPLVSTAMSMPVMGAKNSSVAQISKIHFMDQIYGDEEFFLGQDCLQIFTQVSDGQILSAEQLLGCWFNDGKSDLALISVKEAISGPMLTIAHTPVEAEESSYVLRQEDCVAEDVARFKLAAVHVQGIKNDQIVFKGRDETGHPVKFCGGSGGVYLRKKNSSALEIFAIHSASIPENITVKIHEKLVTLPPFFHGGTYLTAPAVSKWMEEMAKKEELDLCGINLDCKGSENLSFPPPTDN